MQSLGAYRIERLLGEGGMGKVYEAEERLSGRHVALKVLRPELARSEPARRLFENEMSILARLDHPNVVRCLACTEIDGELVMALELLPGRTLRQLLATEEALDWQRALAIVQQIASALAAAHEHEPPIVHRDLKPENVMILDDGTIKVTDFGIAKVLAAIGNATTHSVGTLQYMSPEQIDAAPIDARSDLYALGLVLYELLTGRPPFESSSPRELLNMQCTKAPPELPESVRRALPRGIERLLVELLEKSPGDRPGSAADVLHAIEPFVPLESDARSARTPSSRRSVNAPLPSPPGVSRPSSPEKPAKSEHERTEPSPAPVPEVSPGRDDTLLLLQRASLPRELPLRRALLVIAALSALSGIATYALRASGAPGKADVAVSRIAP
ncbi:MAG TPA: serine/threonine-protein kinase [Polyangiaceae bacterium]